MKRNMLELLFAIAIFPAASALMAASIQPNFSYQGQLLNADGTPADGMFDIHLSIYQVPEGGVALWEETQIGVQVDNGLLNVIVGASDPPDPDVFANSNDEGDYVMRYLEVQVGADPPLMPRTQLLAAPYSAASGRMAGDFFSLPGAIKIYPPDPAQQPPDPDRPEFGASVSDVSTQVVMVPPPDADHPPSDDELPAIQILSDNFSHTLRLNWQLPPPDDGMPEMQMMVDEASSSLRMGAPMGGSAATFTMFDPSAVSSDNTISEMSAGVGGQFSWLMFNPQPEPPRQIMDMNTGPGGEISWTMFNPQPEPPGRGILGMSTNSDGADFAMTSPQFGGLRDEIMPPMIKLSTLGDLSTFKMFDPTAGPDGGAISDMTANVGGEFSWKMFNPQPEPPGRQIMQMDTGPSGEISWIMFNPQPEPPGRGILGMITNSNGADFAMTSPQYGGGGPLDDVTPPMIKLSTLGELSTIQMLDPSVGTNGGVISEMGAGVGGQFSWRMFNPQPEPPGRQIMEMNTGPGGEISWVMFNPQPEPPGEPWMDFGTDAQGPHFQMAGPMGGGGRLDITEPMINISADSAGPEIVLQKNFVDVSGVTDSTRIRLMTDSTGSKFDMDGPYWYDTPSIEMINDMNGPMVAIGAAPTNIITVQIRSATDPIADAWTTYSSRRWKKNIKTIHNALDKVERLRGVTFDWKADGKHDIGLIAEEVGEVIPEVVAYEDNGVDAKSVDYARLVSVLIEGMKEQQQKIDELERRVKEDEEIRARLSDLESALDAIHVKMEKEKGEILLKQASN